VESSPITRAGLRLTTEAPFAGFGIRYWNCDPDKVLAATGPAGSNMRLQTFRSGDPLILQKNPVPVYSPDFRLA
jgi:hypothetical protein